MRQQLPLQFDRQFRLWSYRVTQRRLELRTDRNFEVGETLYVIFLDVLAMQVRNSFQKLEIAEAEDIVAMDDFADIPGRHSSRYLRLSVGDGQHTGFVVCATIDTRIEPPEM